VVFSLDVGMVASYIWFCGRRIVVNRAVADEEKEKLTAIAVINFEF